MTFCRYNARAKSKYALKQYEEAVRDYDEAIKLDDLNPVYLFNRADTKHEMERYDDAIVDFDRYVEEERGEKGSMLSLYVEQ